MHVNVMTIAKSKQKLKYMQSTINKPLIDKPLRCCLGFSQLFCMQ